LSKNKSTQILDADEQDVKRVGYNFQLETKILLEILNIKKDDMREFQKDISLKWDEFNKNNKNKVIKRTFTTFFYDNFHHFFGYFLQNFFGFDENSIKLTKKEKISDDLLILEYDYTLTSVEDKHLKDNSKKFDNQLYEGVSSPMRYLYFLVRHLGMIIRKTIQEKTFILLDALTIQKGEKNNILNFMILIKDSKDEVFHSYYQMVLYYFLRPFEEIPEKYFRKLLEGREKLYQLALEKYPFAKEKLVDLLYYFYKKCTILQSFSPLLDFFNFVGARVEDSLFSKVDIIKKEYLINMDEYSDTKKNVIIEFFDYLDKKSTLYSTFQANNLPSPQSQLNLFLLYMKYYLGSGLEVLEVGDLLFLPKIFKTTLNGYNNNVDDVIGTNSINNIQNFLNFLYALSNIEYINLFFRKIFKKNISQLNYGFFKTFLRSFNSNFMLKINQKNEALLENPENSPLSFNLLVENMCRILYVLIEKIFLKEDPNDASKNFIDPRSRYIGKNIALRVLELFVFQDINYSDDIWPDYVISLNKDNIKKEVKEPFNLSIPSTSFYTDEELTQIMLTYNIESCSDQQYFEEWLIHEIIIPLNDLILNIKNSVDDPANDIEVYEKLSEFFLKDVEDKEMVKDYRFICQQLAPFWKTLERSK